MPRQKKQVVDYFPHYCNHKKTIYILEQKYKTKGYCFWFKLLEELGKHDGHFLDFNDETYCEYFSAKTMISLEEMFKILDLLAKLNAIDNELWKNKLVWCQNFIDNLNPIYERRVSNIPKKPEYVNRNK